MESRVCGNCMHFRQHYIRYARGNYFALKYGHFVKPRLKKRYREEKACNYWQEKQAAPYP